MPNLGFVSPADVGVIDLTPWGILFRVTTVCAAIPGCLEAAAVVPEVVAGAAAGYLVYKGIQAGVQIYQARKPDLRQFDEAVRRIQARCGKKLTDDERRRLHDAITKQGYGLDIIVEIRVGMFCPGK